MCNPPKARRMFELHPTFIVMSILTSLLCFGCAAQTKGKNCNPPSGWETIAEISKGKTLIIGEVHGTNEIPDAFTSYVCAVAEREDRVLVGLEINEFYEDVLNLADKSNEPGKVLREQMNGPSSMNHWSLKDGRGSQAMLRNMIKLYDLDNVVIVPFLRPQAVVIPENLTSQEDIEAWLNNALQEESQTKHEEALASALIEKKESSHSMIVLVGNLHAAKASFQGFASTKPMAMFLPQTTITLNAEYDAGESSNLSSDGTNSQKYSLNGNRKGTPNHVNNRMMGLSSKLNPHYDGYFYVGQITSSAPVIDE